MTRILAYLLLTSVLFTFSACGGDDDESDRSAEDKAAIEQYLVDNGLEAESTSEGLYYIIEEPGDDRKPTATSDVEVTYSGYYLDGVLFDTFDKARFNLSRVIRGWKIGIPLFGIGGKGKLLIPSGLAYGSNPGNGIRDNAVMIFDVEVHDVDGLVALEQAYERENEEIAQYIADNNLTPIEGPEGLLLVIDEEGSAEKPDSLTEVRIHYKGTLLNGQQFDSSYDRGVPSNLNLANTIRGWKLGIPNFGRGGSGKLIVPFDLGYGSQNRTGIPAYSTLVFDIELIDF